MVVPRGLEARSPAILMQVDSRDIGLYERLLQRGYRLIGFPTRDALQISARGLPMTGVDLLRDSDPAGHARIISTGPALISRLTQLIRDPQFAAHMQRDPHNAASVVALLDDTLRRTVTDGVATVEIVDRLVTREHIRLVLLRDQDAHPGAAIAIAAGLRGVRTLHVLHGMPWAATTNTRLHTDVTAGYGEWISEWFLRWGNAARKIAITGNPVWDSYPDVTQYTDRCSIKSSLGLDPDLPLVLYASTICGGNRVADFTYWDWPWQYAEQVTRAVAFIHRQRRVQFALKLHPMSAQTEPDAVMRHEQLLAAHGVPGIVLTGWADPRHIYAADVVIHPESTLGIEAMLLDRPTVTLQIGAPFQSFLYSEADGMLVVKEASELVGAIEAALFDPATQAALAQRRQASVYRFAYLNDGQARERLLYLIDTLLDPAAAEQRLVEGALAPLMANPSAAQRASAGQQHLAQAQRELTSGRAYAAALLAERAQSLLDDAGGALLMHGYARYQLGQREAALASFQQASAAEPENPVFLSASASVLHELGRSAEAETLARRALSADPDHLDALITLGDILLATGRTESAREMLHQASRLAPDDPQVAELLNAAG